MITNITNASFNSGRFPAKLRQITPLLKKAGLDATEECNFRPNPPNMSKLLERLERPVQIATAFAQFPELQYPSVCIQVPTFH